MTSHHPESESPTLWTLFQQTYLLASRYFESVTARYGLSHPQAAVLAVLQQHGRPLPLSHVARLLTQEAQSTTELADRLERRGFVRRVRDQRDRRLVLLELTVEGRATIDQVQPALRDAGERLFGAIAPAHRAELPAVLHALRQSAADHVGFDRARFGGTSGADSGQPS